MSRPTNGGTSTALFSNLVPGPIGVYAEAFASSDATGIALAKAGTVTTVPEQQEARISLSLVSTVARITVTPPNVVGIGKTVALSISAYDADNNLLVLAPEALQITSDNPSILTVGADQSLQGVAYGSAAITIRDTESGVSVTTPPIPVRPAKWLACFLTGNVLHNDGMTIHQFRVDDNDTIVPLPNPSVPAGLFTCDLQAHPKLPYAYAINLGTNRGQGSVCIYKIEETGLTLLHTISYAENAFPTCIRFSPDGKFAYVSDYFGVLQYKVEPDGNLTPLNPSRFLINASGNFGSTYLEASADGRYLYSRVYDSAYRVFSFTATGQLALLQNKQTTYARSIYLDPKGRALYDAVGFNHGIDVFLLTSGQLQNPLPMIAPNDSIESLAVSRDGRYVWASYESSTFPDNLTPVRTYPIAASGTISTYSLAMPGKPDCFGSMRLHPTKDLMYTHPYWSGNSIDENRFGLYQINSNGSLTPLGPATPPDPGHIGPYFLPVAPSTP
ncbi:MAG: beta-propeller fold lactonase family protein [Armatimonas sp.]